MAKITKKNTIAKSKAAKPSAAKTKKPVVSKKVAVKKAAVKKAPVKKTAPKKVTARKPASKKVDHVNSLKAAIANIEKSSGQVFDSAKFQAQQYAKQTMALVARYNDDLKKLMLQDKTLQQKLQDAEAKVKTKASATNKAATKKAQKLWSEVKKQQQQTVTQLRQSEMVQSMAKNLESKLNFLAKQLRDVAKSWRPEPAKAAKPKTAKPAAAKPAAAKKVAEPKPVPAKSTPPAANKPAPAHKAPTQTETSTTLHPAPAKSPFSMPIIPQKPLGGTQHNQEPTHKPFGGFKDDF